MPRPPIMPFTYGQTGFRLAIDVRSPILDSLKVAGADTVAIPGQEIEDRINEVVSRFLDARQHAVSKPDFRLQAKRLRKVLDPLIAGLPDDHSALAAELAHHWQYAQISAPQKQYTEGFAVIGQQTPIAHLRAELQRFSSGLNALAGDVGVGKKGRVPALEEHEFVKALATLFADWTGVVRSQWIQEKPENTEDRATGPFPDFVRAVLNETRDQMVDRLRRQGKMVGRGKFEPLTTAEAMELVGPLKLSTNLSSLIEALGLKQSGTKQG